MSFGNRQPSIASGLARGRGFGMARPTVEISAKLEERSAAPVEVARPEVGSAANSGSFESKISGIKDQVIPLLLDRIDTAAAAQLSREQLSVEFRPVIEQVLTELQLTLNHREQLIVEQMTIDELLGLGPLEPLINDPTVNDIMVNGPHKIYVERKGRVELTDVKFRDEAHALQIAQRICNKVGRRVDQTSPIADARLPDGSRVNVIIPPLSLFGTGISIRKFSNKPITLKIMADQGNCSPKMAEVLSIASASRLNIVISGGTGSGKTTLLNALSRHIGKGERVITIEDAAELRLEQPHWLSLESRPPNLSGEGAVTIRDLVINALRMRPDRIILGEIRGAECFDMLAAMNTGHDGSLCTLHANSPREALARMENMVMMSDIKVPKEAISRQIADSVDMIVQIKRFRDGKRRITNITEVIGMEGPVIVTQELFTFNYVDEDENGAIIGEFKSAQLRPYTIEKAREFGLDRKYAEACL